MHYTHPALPSTSTHLPTSGPTYPLPITSIYLPTSGPTHHLHLPMPCPPSLPTYPRPAPATTSTYPCPAPPTPSTHVLPLPSLHLPTLVFGELAELALGPLLRFGVGGVPEGVVRVVLKRHPGSGRPLGVLLTKPLRLHGHQNQRQPTCISCSAHQQIQSLSFYSLWIIS